MNIINLDEIQRAYDAWRDKPGARSENNVALLIKYIPSLIQRLREAEARLNAGDGRRPEIERLLSLAEEVGTPPYNYLASKAPLVIDAARKSIGEIREVLGRVAQLEFCLASEEASHSVTCRKLTDAECERDLARADRDRLAARVAELEADLRETEDGAAKYERLYREEQRLHAAADKRVSDLKFALGDDAGWFDRCKRAEQERDVARERALEEACVAACTICGEDCPADGPDGGGLYWHSWSPPGEPPDDYPCEASAIRALKAGGK
jgi:DNA-binding transcriptional MerR regulator